MAHPAPDLTCPCPVLLLRPVVLWEEREETPTSRKEGGHAQGRCPQHQERVLVPGYIGQQHCRDLTVLLIIRFISFIRLQSWVLRTGQVTQDQTYTALNLKALN